MRRSLFILWIMLMCIVEGICQLYNRIPKYQVGRFMQYYLEEIGINDCFYHITKGNKLYLKCLRNDQLITLCLFTEGWK